MKKLLLFVLVVFLISMIFVSCDSSIKKIGLVKDFDFTVNQEPSGNTTFDVSAGISIEKGDVKKDLKYILISSLDGVSIHQDTGVLTITPEYKGLVDKVTVRVESKKDSKVFKEVDVTIVKPLATNATISGNTTLYLGGANEQYTVDTVTPANAYYKFGLDANPTNSTIDPNTGILTIGDTAGDIKVQVLNKDDAVAGELSVELLDPHAVTAVTVDDFEITQVDSGDTPYDATQHVDLEPTPANPEQDVTYSITTPPEGVSVDENTGDIIITSLYDGGSSDTVELKVTSKADVNVYDTANVTIKRPVATSATISGNISLYLGGANEQYTVTSLTPANAYYKFGLDANSTNSTIDSNTGILTIGDTAGNITVQALDKDDLVVGELSVEILDIHVVTSITVNDFGITQVDSGDTSYDATQNVDLEPNTADPNKDVTYSITTPPEGVSVDGDTGEITITSTYDGGPSDTVELVVTSKADPNVSDSADVTITRPPLTNSTISGDDEILINSDNDYTIAPAPANAYYSVEIKNSGLTNATISKAGNIVTVSSGNYGGEIILQIFNKDGTLIAFKKISIKVACSTVAQIRDAIKVVLISTGQLTPDGHIVPGVTELTGDFNFIKLSPSLTDLSGLFYSGNEEAVPNYDPSFSPIAKIFNGDISQWDVSNVIEMYGMLALMTKFNQPLNDWDVSSVENMLGLFSGNILFNKPLDKWNVSNVETMYYMFHNAASFNQDISSWERTDSTLFNVTNMSSMFENAASFDQNVSGWNVTNVVNHDNVFKGSAMEGQTTKYPDPTWTP